MHIKEPRDHNHSRRPSSRMSGVLPDRSALYPLWFRQFCSVSTLGFPPPLRDPTVRRAGRAKRARGAREARSPSLLGARSAPLPPGVPGSRGQSGAARRQARVKQRRNAQGCHTTPEELNFPEGRRGGAVRLRDKKMQKNIKKKKREKNKKKKTMLFCHFLLTCSTRKLEALLCAPVRVYPRV